MFKYVFDIDIIGVIVGEEMLNDYFYPVFDSDYYPKYATWEMTLKCNMNCLHCGSKAGQARENELSEAECIDIANQLIKMGNENTTLIGGEILLVPFWFKIAKTFADAGVNVNIITNGFDVGKKQIEEIKQSGVGEVYVSVDGLQKNHDIIRNRVGAFDRVINAVKLIQNAGFYVGATTTILDINFNDLEGMYQLFNELNICVWQLQIAAPMGRCANYRNALLNPQKMDAIVEFISRKRQLDRWPIVLASDNIGYYSKLDENLRSVDLKQPSCFTGCAAGLFNIGIDSVGNVRGCESLYSEEFIEGNLRQESLETIWNREGAFTYNRQFYFSMLHGKCKNCDKGYICAGGCRQLSYFSSKDGHFYDNIYCNYKSNTLRN